MSSMFIYICMYVYMHTHTHTHIYIVEIYIYIKEGVFDRNTHKTRLCIDRLTKMSRGSQAPNVIFSPRSDGSVLTEPLLVELYRT